jgi:hypothetical protein
MPIEIRRNRNDAPQSTHEFPGLRFTEANFSVNSMDCGLGNILETYPREGYSTLDTDMFVFLVYGYLAIEEKGQETKEVAPGNIVCIPKGTTYRWRQLNDDEVLVFTCNSPPFDPAKR